MGIFPKVWGENTKFLKPTPKQTRRDKNGEKLTIQFNNLHSAQGTIFM